MHININKKKFSFLFVLILSAFLLSIVKIARSLSQESTKPNLLAKAGLLSFVGSYLYILAQKVKIRTLVGKLRTDFKERFLNTAGMNMKTFIEQTNPIEQFNPHAVNPYEYIISINNFFLITTINKLFNNLPNFLDEWIKKFKKLTYTEASWFMKNYFFYPVHHQATYFVSRLENLKIYFKQMKTEIEEKEGRNSPLIPNIEYERNIFRRAGLLGN